jgi:hypothetical protein
MARPLPPSLPPAPVDERLVAALAAAVDCSTSTVRHWLDGSTRPPQHLHAPLRDALWSVLGGVSGRVLVRRVDRPAEGIVARAANNGERGGA